MKTILKLRLAVLAAMTTMSTYAIDGDFLLNVKKGNGKEISFSVNEIQKASVTIYDKDHNLIYSEVATGKGGILKTYSLEEFPDGIYFLEVETNSKKVTHEIVIKNEVSTLSRKSLAEVYKADLKMANQNVATAN
ncbi:T9SS type A sorting domain-containing protein [Flavobacterium sp. N3904]|uniref:T9SS type A sorting domain-containing protein n=1 Tax=Flavobacterium sp. N3904 TaxID=2986835 RepID=UPI0022241861|nr:T9SS type A sorting domain-containing protein [Flavobacterium sp. N3904]